MLLSALIVCTLQAPTAPARDYDFSAATALLDAELGALQGDVAVIIQQSGREIYRYQAGAIDFDTVTPVASLTKTVSAAVILDLVEEGTLDLDRTIGEEMPLLFGGGPLGDATHLDCWAMRHGVETLIPYRYSSLFTHQQAVFGVAMNGMQAFAAGGTMSYDGTGMQVSGFVAAQLTGLDWESLARQRILAPLGMDTSDYGRFDPNPAVAGGLRTTAEELSLFGAMVMAEGRVGAVRVLETASIEQLFTNHTGGLPVGLHPWPVAHPSYPYGQRPEYGFGGWILAQDPATDHVEEVMGAGAWGSQILLDRRRGVSVAFIVDVPQGSQAALPAALGLYEVTRGAVEALQVRSLAASVRNGGDVQLSWVPPARHPSSLVYGSEEPILDVFDLRAAKLLGRATGGKLTVPVFQHYAVVAWLRGGVNEALVPGQNVTSL